MIIRVFRAKAKDGRIDELMKLVEQNNIPYVETQPGLIDRYTARGIGENADEFLMFTVWESFEALHAMRGSDATRRTAELIGETFHYEYETVGPPHSRRT